MVYWWNLDCQLTRNWTDYWWKEWCIDGSIFHHFGSQKMRFCRVLKPTVSWTSSILQLIFCILEVRKCDICRVVKTRVQCYEASCEQILRILASWKCDFRRFAKPLFQGTSQRELKFFQSSGLEIRICSVVKKPRLKGTKLCVSKFIA